MKFFLIFSLLFCGLSACPAFANPTEDTLRFVRQSPDYTEITAADGVALDLRYARSDNFTGRNLYGPFNRVFLHKLAADKLRAAAALLKQEHPTYHLVILDALRPRSVQAELWAKVAGTPQEKYVADPKKGSIHNYGFSLDLSVVDEKGRQLDMGTPFDDFSLLSEPQLEDEKLAAGELTPAQIANRKILRKPMEAAGFKGEPEEWWHFDALPPDLVRRRFNIVE